MGSTLSKVASEVNNTDIFYRMKITKSIDNCTHTHLKHYAKVSELALTFLLGFVLCVLSQRRENEACHSLQSYHRTSLRQRNVLIVLYIRIF